MTASAQSIAGLIASTVGRDWLYSPSAVEGVLDFKVDNRWFRILVLDEAQDIEYVEVLRVDDAPLSLTATESAQIARAQALADAADNDTAAQEVLSGDELLEALDEGNFGGAQAAEFEIGGEG